jgi:hypothetical protein
MSTANHPETDGASKHTNKTVKCNQLCWARALPHIHFDMMNTINKSTGFMPFQLHMGSPCIIPPLILAKSNATVTDVDAWDIIQQLEFKAQDNLL